MADLDEQGGRLTVKLVYYGPALSGKTTNLMALHNCLAPDLLGELMTLETQGDRTLFFDLLPVGFRAPSGLIVKFRLFTVPGQVAHDSTRKAVLSRADGVVFIADSDRRQSVNNTQSFENLAENAARVGLDFDRLPLVVQFNKRDLPDIVSPDEVRRRWGETSWPVTFASAVRGEGVRDTLEALLRRTYVALDDRFDLDRVHGCNADLFTHSIVGVAPCAGAG